MNDEEKLEPQDKSDIRQQAADDSDSHGHAPETASKQSEADSEPENAATQNADARKSEITIFYESLFRDSTYTRDQTAAATNEDKPSFSYSHTQNAAPVGNAGLQPAHVTSHHSSNTPQSAPYPYTNTQVYTNTYAQQQARMYTDETTGRAKQRNYKLITILACVASSFLTLAMILNSVWRANSERQQSQYQDPLSNLRDLQRILDEYKERQKAAVSEDDKRSDWQFTLPSDAEGNYRTQTDIHGDEYVGGYKNNLKSGFGTYTWANGDKYEGEWKYDQRSGQGTQTYANGDVYSGEWKDDQRNGQGTWTEANGDVYEGEWKDDQRNGHGTWTSISGTVYDGEWKDGVMHGQGTCTQRNGDSYIGEYVGEWIYGFRCGQGTYTDADGNVYTGEWKNSKPNGHGVFTGYNGDVYDGEIKDGLQDGQGTYTWADGSTYIGEWKDGNKDGQGTRTYILYDVYFGEYTGEWKDGEPEGQGTYTYNDGSKYVGEWKDGKREGYGTLYNADGTIDKQGQWKDTNFVE